MKPAFVLGAALALTAAHPALAQPVIVADSGDSAWVLCATLLVLIAALPGMILQRGGHAHGTAILLSGSVATLAFVALGYSLAFAPGSAMLGNTANIMLANLADLRPATTIPESLYAAFQLALALFAVASLAASLAPRARIGWLLGFVGFWLLLVYVPVAHWMWGDGWLATLGALDFTGGIVVQLTAGVAALVAALLIGRSDGRDMPFDSDTTMAGSALVWAGWVGAIGGAALGGGDGAAAAILNALIATATATLTGFALACVDPRHRSSFEIAPSALAGIAAIAAGAGYVGPFGAMVLGVLGALAAAAAALLVRVLRIETGAHAFVTYGSGAAIGAIAFPLFIVPVFGGPGFAEGYALGGQIVAQILAVTAVALWTAFATAIAALMVSVVLPMRGDTRR